MAEAIDTEAHKQMADELNQTDLTSEIDPADQQPQHVYAPPSTSATTSRVPFLRSHGEMTQDPRSLHPPQREEERAIVVIAKMIEDCEDGLLSGDCWIYRVPTKLRHLKEEAYIPKVVSIGPFHHGSETLEDMEKHKPILFKRFTQRAAITWQEMIPIIEQLVPAVRLSYSETIVLPRQQLVKLILMDAGFIIGLFMAYKDFELRLDAKLSEEGLEDSIREDLILIENQLPFFAIEDLYNEAFPENRDRSSDRSFLQLAYNFFGCYNKQKLENAEVKIKHFTDLLRLFYLDEKNPRQDYNSAREGSHILLYKVNSLQDAGIKLKASKSKCLLDLKFSGHTLEIPQILVEENTELLFRNMIAFEQRQYPEEACITGYALVMGWLIDTSKDVDLLVDKKIVLQHGGDSSNVASVLKGLSQNVIQTNFRPKYVDLCLRLNEFCEDPKHKMKATLRQDYWNTLMKDYCSTPWRAVASMAAVILLVLTVVQTLFSILQVVLK